MRVRHRSARGGALACGLFALAALCSGCASDLPLPGSAPTATAEPVPPPAAPQDPLLGFVVTAAPGQAGIVPDPPHGRVRVRVDREYASAEGVLCRRFSYQLLDAPGAAIETRAACREPGGWRMTAIGSTGAISGVP